MRQTCRIVAVIASSVLLAGCFGRGVHKQINPPGASIQQLAVHANGQWQLTVRLQNFSNVATAFQSVQAKLVVADQEAGSLTLNPATTIGPDSADAVTAVLQPALGAKLVVASALSAGQPVRYVLSGTIVTSEPKGNYDFTFDSTLNPAPGLNGVMR